MDNQPQVVTLEPSSPAVTLQLRSFLTSLSAAGELDRYVAVRALESPPAAPPDDFEVCRNVSAAEDQIAAPVPRPFSHRTPDASTRIQRNQVLAGKVL